MVSRADYRPRFSWDRPHRVTPESDLSPERNPAAAWCRDCGSQFRVGDMAILRHGPRGADPFHAGACATNAGYTS